MSQAVASTEVKALRVFSSEEARSRFIAAYNDAVCDWPVTKEEIDVPTRFGATHIIASGRQDAPALFLLPGKMANATLWRPNVAALSQHYRVYSVDVVGEPTKSVPIRPMLKRTDYAEWFVDLLDALKIERAFIVGNSYGGFLALNQASLTPERVQRVVLISPSGFTHITWKLVYYGFQNRYFGTDALQKWLANGVAVDPRNAGLSAPLSIAFRYGRMVNPVPPPKLATEELRRIKVPSLLLIGDKEVVYNPYRVMKGALERMPQLEGAIVPGATHAANLSRPDEINERIIRFFQRKGS